MSRPAGSRHRRKRQADEKTKPKPTESPYFRWGALRTFLLPWPRYSQYGYIQVPYREAFAIVRRGHRIAYRWRGCKARIRLEQREKPR
jgi:hypothetical protein